MELTNLSLISTFVILFASAIVGGIVAKKLKQPALLGYIGAGVLFGNVFPALSDQAILSVIAQVGLTLLLFTLGIEFSFFRLRKILRTVAWAAAAQMLLSFFLFFLLLLWLSFAFLPALFIAVAASLSSTAVVVKVLSERAELDTVPGEVMTGWLVVQDLAVVPIMILLPTLVVSLQAGDVQTGTLMSTVGISIVKAIVAIGVILAFGRRVMPWMLAKVAGLGSREIFVLFTVGFVLLAAALSHVFGLSAALGAFIAGILIAETTQNHAIFSEIRPLRDVFAVVFFVSLGMALPVSFLMQSGLQLLVLSVIVIGIKWFIVMGLTRFLGYHRKTAFLVAVGLTQMSEFGFVIASEGLRIRAISYDQYTLLVGLTFVTILISTPLLSQGHSLYYKLHSSLGKFWPALFHTTQETKQFKNELPFENHIVLCGYGRVGKYIGRALEMAGVPFLVVDYNSATIAQLKDKGIPVVYGDPADRDVLDYAQVDKAKAIIIAIPDRHTQELVIGHAQTLNRRIKIICRTHHEEDQRHLKSLGVDTVIQPEFEAALSVVSRLLPDFGVVADEITGKIQRLKIEHGLG